MAVRDHEKGAQAIMKPVDCIIVFTKVPLADKVKTRLVKEGFLDTPQAKELYEAFLSDVLETAGGYAADNCLDLVISYTPKEGLSKIISITEQLNATLRVASLILQEGTAFDQRIVDAFRKAFDLGYTNAVMIGGDSPTTRKQHLDEAFKILREPDKPKESLVLGPSSDGGVYLIGLRKGSAFDFSGMFTKKAGDDISLIMIENKAREMSLHTFKTSLHYDVDVPEDVVTLREELSKNPDLAPHTRRTLKRLGLMTSS